MINLNRIRRSLWIDVEDRDDLSEQVSFEQFAIAAIGGLAGI
jgi:hypothetical protein